MIATLAPILAQLVTLNLADRTEARFIPRVVNQYQAETRPAIGVSVGFPRVALTLTYAPFVLAPRLDSDPSYLVVFHTAALVGAYKWRRSFLTLSEYGGYGKRDPVADALGLGTPLATSVAPPAAAPGAGGPPSTANPATPGMPVGTTIPGGTTATTGASGTQAPFLPGVVRLQVLTTAASFSHQLTPALSLRADASYSVSGGVDAASKATFPVIRGPTFVVSVDDRLTRADRSVSSLYVQYSLGAQETKTWLALATERLLHAFTPLLAGSVGIGLGLTGNSQSNGEVLIGAYPALDAGMAYTPRLAGGDLALASGLTLTPALDPVRNVIDPRLGVTAGARWTRDRFSIGAASAAWFSLAGGDNAGAYDAVTGNASTAYRLTTAVAIDCGVRGAYQSFEGQVALPFTWVAFAGLTFGALLPLNGSAPRPMNGLVQRRPMNGPAQGPVNGPAQGPVNGNGSAQGSMNEHRDAR